MSREVEDLRRRVEILEREMRQRSAQLPVRFASGGGGSSGGLGRIDRVDEFPAMPVSGDRLVLFTGDNQIWWGNAENTRWYPASKFTSYAGTVGEEA